MNIGTHHDRMKSSTRLALTASLVVLASGCVSEFKPAGNSSLILPDDEQIETIHRIDDRDGTSMTAMTSLSTAFRVRRLGSVDYNGANLPLLTFKDTGYIATQEGLPPSAALICAQLNNRAKGTNVAIYQLGRSDAPERIVQSDDGILIGRNGNQDGFLVERPNKDGSRSIGQANWTDGTIEWLIDDGRVNAFGWISESGRIVYSTKSVKDRNFVLGILEADGSRWKIEESLPFSWVFPIFEATGDSIFAARLGDGYADMVHGSVANAGEFRKTMKSHRMSNRTNVVRVNQMMSTSTTGPRGNSQVIAWYSYELGRMVVWNCKKLKIDLLPEDSVSAFPMNSEHNWLITTADGLDRTALFVSDQAQDRLVDFPWMARTMRGNSVFIIEPVEREIRVGLIEFGSDAK